MTSNLAQFENTCSNSEIELTIIIIMIIIIIILIIKILHNKILRNNELKYKKLYKLVKLAKVINFETRVWISSQTWIEKYKMYVKKNADRLQSWEKLGVA